MKRKKDLNSSYLEGEDTSKSSHSFEHSLSSFTCNKLTKILVLIALNSLLWITTSAKEAQCKAGFSCENGVTVECEPGWYSLEGDKKCNRCKQGFYCPLTTEGPLECPDGEYSAATATKCEKCPAGFICKLYNEDTQFIRCAMGTWTEMGGTECLSTPKGHYSASPAQPPLPCFDGYYTTEENSAYCTLCPRGHQCKEKDKEPEECPEGTYAGISSIECTKCPEDMYCPKGAHRPQECPENEPDCLLKKYTGLMMKNSGKRSLIACGGGQYDVNSVCVSCPEGWRWPGGSAAIKCAAGTYSSTGASSCTTCESGYVCPTQRQTDRYYCPAGFVYDTNHCRPCKEGFYCTGGASEVSCTAGTNYSPGGLSACLSCPASKECNIYTYIDCTEGYYYLSNVCTACPVGSYCRDNTRTLCSAGEYMPFKGFSFCLECPAQTMCATTGLSAYTECAVNQEWAPPGSTTCNTCAANYECFVGYTVPCPGGSYSNANDFECHLCPAGKSCTSGNAHVQANCGSGTYSPAGSMECFSCPTGHMCPDTKMSKPIPCRPGQYQSSTSQTACSTCADGTFSNTHGAVTCSALPAGHYSGSFKGAALPCPVGTYPTADYTSCQACTAGKLCGIGESSASPAHANCPLGYYCPVSGSKVVMRPCSAGKWGTTEGQSVESSACSNCAAGYYCPGGTHLPIPCPVNAYCAGAGAAPTVCSSGTYNKKMMQTSSAACLACSGALYCAEDATGLPWNSINCDSNSPTSITCPAGQYMPIHKITDVIIASGASCEACPKGHYCLAGTIEPTPCPVGTYRGVTSALALSDCTACPAGKACPFVGIVDANGASACAYGHYCPAGTDYPTDNPCPAGKFSDNTNNDASSDWVNCAAGYGCTAGANTYTNPPTICSAGYYCPAGSSTTTQNQCPAGTYSSNTGLTASTECITCPAGSYCSAGSVAETGLCSAGYYCPEGSGTATDTACPTGTYSAGTGLKTLSECTTCPLGYVCATTAMTAPVKCAAGTYGPTAGIGASATTCTTCPAGYYCPEGATTPTACGAGYYSVAGSKDSGSPVCVICPAGSYCAFTATKSTEVTACAAGFICPIGTSEVPSHPTYSCPAGYWWAAGVAAGTACGVGTYNPTSGKETIAACLTVPAGYYVDTAGTSSYAANVCPAGYWCLAGATSATTNPCPAGTYRSFTGGVQSTDCADCPTGYYCGINTVTPIECPQGYYCENGVSEPTKCPKATYGADSNLRSSADCTICPQGRYCSQAGLTEPDGLCDSGYYCGEGSTSPAPPTRRMLYDASGKRILQTGGVCPAGGYCEQGSKYPTRCPPGTFSIVAGQDEASDCIACTNGHYCIGTIDPNTSGQCSAGYYCNNNSTAPTQNVANPGYYATTGSASQTQCATGTYNPFYAQSACLACKAGYYCPNLGMSVMLECPVGKYCGASTTVPADCPAGTYNDRTKLTASSECKACPPGKYCTAGQSAPNGDCTAGRYCRTSATTATPAGSATNFGQCQPGYYCPTGTGDPIQCHPGTFNSATGSTSSAACSTCTTGKYCSQPALTAVEGNCPAGYYCPAGTSVKFPTTFCDRGYYCPAGSSSITIWPGGSYQNAPRQGYCRTCPAGYTCAAGAIAFEANPCSAGKYCPAGQSTETVCPTGTYNPSTTKKALSDCILWDPGAYCSGTGLIAISGNCTAGYYCTIQSTTPTPASATSTGGPCDAGYYCPAGSVRKIPCPPGKYCSGTLLAAPSGDCSAGYYCVGSATINNPTVLGSHGGAICPAGSYCVAGSSSPTPCSPGYYRASTGGTASTSCTICPGGSYCSTFGATAITGTCTLGYFCPAGSLQPNDINNICPAGYRCPAGATSATICVDPYYQDQKGQGVCKTCLAGYKCTLTSRTLCRPDQSTLSFYCTGTKWAEDSCTAGTITNVIGAESQSDCVSCPPGYYCPNSASLSKVVECQAGTYCSGGVSVSTGTATCPIGHYCPAGTNEPIKCTPGQYCGTTGLQLPTGNCTAGYFCLEGSQLAAPTDGTQGNICPAGSYCPTGSSINIECPVGTYNANTEATAESNCVVCDAGKKCLSRGLTAPSTTCPAGYHCTQDPFELNDCTPGNYCPAGSDDETKCGTGQYQQYKLQSSCDACPQGFYCSQLDTSRKTICPSGSFWVASQSATTNCPAGRYNPREGVTASTDCEQCPYGKYCGTAGLVSTGSDCAAGYYCNRGESANNANICPAGYYCPSGTVAPIPCPAGTYNTATGKSQPSECLNCAVGTYCASTASTTATPTGNCAAGYYCISGARTPFPLDGTTGRLCSPGYYCTSGATTEALCLKGGYNPYSGLSACLNCPQGYYCDGVTDTTSYILCPAGSYCPLGDHTSDVVNKVDCPAGTYSERTGLHAASQCTSCDPGKYCLGGGTAPNGNCSPGYVCPRGATTATPNTITFVMDPTSVDYNKPGVCPKGHYCPSGSYIPIPCPVGQYQPSTTQSICIDCPAGKYCDKTAITDTEIASKDCAAGHFCSGGTKVEKPIKTSHNGNVCSSGKYCPTGTATELNCTGGYYDNRRGSGACMVCPKGYYCPIGSKKPILCPANMYCAAQVAAGTYCPDGTYNTESGLEESAQCRPCPGGKYCQLGTIVGQCDAGYNCDSGAAAAQDPLKECPINHYCEAGTSVPVRCESGTIRTTTKGTSPADCRNCIAGNYCPEFPGGTEYTCPKGHYCEEKVIQPTACSVGKYVNATGSDSILDCTACPAGALCNEEGVGDYLDFLCPVGFYCLVGAKEAISCPEGTYRDTTGAAAIADCHDCPGGFYCEEETINPIVCPAATYCPINSTEPTPCTAGYYCHPETTNPIDWPAAYYCPEGVESYIKCNNGTYCEINSEEPTLCPSGTFGNGNPHNIDMPSGCSVWDAGTYSITSDPGWCFPCTAGYVCLGDTKSATPIDVATENGYECTLGHYCPQGSTDVTPCPKGTYTDVYRTTSLADCHNCAENTYNNATGAKGCTKCGGTSRSSIGSTEWSCIGTGREWSLENNQCLCGKGYKPMDKLKSEDYDSVDDCELIEESICPDDEDFDAVSSKCVLKEELCQLQCGNQGGGTYYAEVNRCECKEQGDYDEIWDVAGKSSQSYYKIKSNGKAQIYDSAGATVGTEFELTEDDSVWGEPDWVRDDGECTATRIDSASGTFTFDCSESPIVRRRLRKLGIYTEPVKKTRRLATVAAITNGITCITSGNSVEWTVDSTTKSYPEYLIDSLLNTNDNFDYSAFTNLANTIESGSSSITTYVHTFKTEGTYVFANSLDNYQQTILKVAAESSTCSSGTTVSAATLAALYSLNLGTSTVDKGTYNKRFIGQVFLILLILISVSLMHSVNKKWDLLWFLKKKEVDEEEMKRQKEILKKKRDVRLKAEELKDIRDELARYVAALKLRIAELEEARKKKIMNNQEQELSNQNKLLKTLTMLKRFVRKRAKIIRNEGGKDFDKEMKQRQLDKYFREKDAMDERGLRNKNEMDEDYLVYQSMRELEQKRLKLKGEDPQYMIDENLKEKLDQEIEDREFSKLDKAQDETRQQVSNYLDDERRKLEERLRREGRLSENEIENILNDYDMNTRDMAHLLQEDERRQQENFKRQLEARKARRKQILEDVERLKAERKKAQEIEAKELEEHFKKQKEEENYVIGKVLADEEKDMRKKMEKELDNKKKEKLKAFEQKLKNARNKDSFKDVLDEYSQREKEVENELNNERKLALMQIQAKINERKRKEKLRISQMNPAQSSVDITSIEKKIDAKMSLLKQEAEDEISDVLKEERRKRQIQAEMSLLRKENDEYIKNLRELNEQSYDSFLRDLEVKYKAIDENEDLLDLGADSVQEKREELADTMSAIKNSKDSEQKKKLQARIGQLKKEIAESSKDPKDDDRIKKLKERARLAEEKEQLKHEYRWKQYDQVENERDALNRKERENWLKREKDAIDAIIDKFIAENNIEGLAEVLDQVYGVGSKVYSERHIDLTNKLQEKKARRLKHSFNDNLDKKIFEIEKQNRIMNPQIKNLNARQHLLPRDEFIKQLKNLMMKENERRAEIEALAASREADAQTKIMYDFIEEQCTMVDGLNSDMKELREHAFNPNRIKDKILKNEAKKINDKYGKEYEKMMKQQQEEMKQRQIDELNGRQKQNQEELEKNRKDFEKLSMFEKQLENENEAGERFKKQNYKLMLDQLNKERDLLGKELTEDEKALMIQKHERKMKNLNKALEKEHDKQLEGHSRQLMNKQKEIEMRKRERELLLNSLSMYKDYRAEEIANEDNFKRLSLLIEEDLEVIDHEAYSYKPMKIYDLIKWKRETDDYLDVLGGDSSLLERVARIEKYIGNLNLSSFARVRNLVNKIKNVK